VAPTQARVRQLRSPPTIASPDESAAAAWERMLSAGVHHVVVLQEGRVVGLLARGDLSGPQGGSHRRMGRRVGELMHRDVVTTTSNASVRRAASLICRSRSECLVVVDRGRLTGVLTVWRLLEWFLAPPASNRPESAESVD